jgi:hypothetical protein
MAPRTLATSWRLERTENLRGEAKETRQAQMTPAAIDMVTEDIEELPGARNQGHRCLPARAGRSEQ